MDIVGGTERGASGPRAALLFGVARHATGAVLLRWVRGPRRQAGRPEEDDRSVCAPYFTYAKASRSTRGCPAVATTTSLMVWVPALDQVFCHAMDRYAVVVA